MLQIMLSIFSGEEIVIEIQYTDHDINHSTRETLLPLSEISMNTSLISVQPSYLDSLRNCGSTLGNFTACRGRVKLGSSHQ